MMILTGKTVLSALRPPYPYGGEFIGHGAQQKATMTLADKKFPGTKGLEDFTLLEEWYALKNFASATYRAISDGFGYVVDLSSR